MTRNRRRAFTLLEVLAALLILATAIFALLQAQTQSVSNTSRMGEQARALAAAETAMDDFLAAPDFQLFGDVFQSEATVTVPGYENEPFTIRRIITEHVPLEEQGTIYVNPNEEPYYPLTDEEAEDLEENPFDPGTFVSIRIEVMRSRGEQRLLAMLETWVPKPMTDEEKEEAGLPTSTSSTTTSSSSGGDGSSSSGSSGGRGSRGGNRGGEGGGPPGGDGGDGGAPPGGGEGGTPPGGGGGGMQPGGGGGTQSGGSSGNRGGFTRSGGRSR